MKKHTSIITIILSTIVLSSAVIITFLAMNSIYSKKHVVYKEGVALVVNEKDTGLFLPVLFDEDSFFLPIEEICDALGYNFFWSEARNMLSMTKKGGHTWYDETFISREGTLDNGRKYSFWGRDKQNDINKILEEWDLVISFDYESRIFEETVVAMAEKVQSFYLATIPPGRAGLNIYYDEDRNSLMFAEDSYDEVNLGGFDVVVVNCDDGLTTIHSTEWR